MGKFIWSGMAIYFIFLIYGDASRRIAPAKFSWIRIPLFALLGFLFWWVVKESDPIQLGEQSTGIDDDGEPLYPVINQGAAVSTIFFLFSSITSYVAALYGVAMLANDNWWRIRGAIRKDH